MKHNVIAFGEVLWDLLPDKAIIGGAPFNFTYRIHSLGNNGYIISKVGKDDLGNLALENIQRLGLTDKYVQSDDTYPTGTVNIFFNKNMEPDFTIVRDVAYDFIDNSAELQELAARADCLCFGTLSQRNRKSRNTLCQLYEAFGGQHCFYDINLRKDCYTKEHIHESLALTEIVKLNNEEALVLRDMFELTSSKLEHIALELAEKFQIKICLITMGEKGALAISGKGEIVYVQGYKIELADPLGSGDAFSAGFIHALLQNKSLEEACTLGNILGAITATQRGATEPISQQQIIQFTEQQLERISEHSLEYYIT